jgi:predicted PhzF superfamily epimerase YddE/YHI9
MMRHGLLSSTRIVIEQRTKMGRRSLLHGQIHNSDAIGVDGHVTSVGAGTIQLLKND